MTNGDTRLAPNPATGLITVLVADDQRVVREGLTLLLGLIPGVQVVATAADGEQAVQRAADVVPDVILMDLKMPVCDGIEAIRRIATAPHRPRILALTTYADDDSVIRALQAGADGYLTKDVGAPELTDALRRVIQGQAVIDPVVQRHLVAAVARGAASPVDSQLKASQPAIPTAGRPGDDPSADPGADPPVENGRTLSPREIDVLRLVAQGLTNTQIATTLFISEATVKTHINHVFAKLDVRDRAQAVSYAFRAGLL